MKLNQIDNAVDAAIRFEPVTSDDVAVETGLNAVKVRKSIALLIAAGRIRKDRIGFVRVIETCENGTNRWIKKLWGKTA